MKNVYVLTMIFSDDNSESNPLTFSTREQAEMVGATKMNIDFQLPEKLRMYDGFRIVRKSLT